MTDEEVQIDRWKPRLRAHLKDTFDKNYDWPEALKAARRGCVAENARLQFISDAIPDISAILDIIEDEAKADWIRWAKGRDA
jgi:hypothetical protein